MRAARPRGCARLCAASQGDGALQNASFCCATALLRAPSKLCDPSRDVAVEAAELAVRPIVVAREPLAHLFELRTASAVSPATIGRTHLPPEVLTKCADKSVLTSVLSGVRAPESRTAARAKPPRAGAASAACTNHPGSERTAGACHPARPRPMATSRAAASRAARLHERSQDPAGRRRSRRATGQRRPRCRNAGRGLPKGEAR